MPLQPEAMKSIAVIQRADLDRLRAAPDAWVLSWKIIDDGDVCKYTAVPAPDRRHVANTAHRAPTPDDDGARWVRVDTSHPGSWRREGAEWVRELVMVVPSARNAFLPNAGLIESDALVDKSVAVVGLGSGGSTIAIELAKAGVGRFILADYDRLEVHNVGRHVCDLSDVGRMKTIAMRDQITARSPAATIHTFTGDVVAQRREFESLLETVDVVMAATDNNASRLMLNRFAVDSEIPTIFGRVYARGCGGDVVMVRPNGPCYHCMFGEVNIEEEVSTTPRDLPVYATELVAPEPGLSLDVAPVAHMCTRLALVELCKNTPSQLATLAEDLCAPMFLWANRRVDQFEEWKPMALGFQDMAVQRWYGIGVDIDPLCPVCRAGAFAAHIAEGTSNES